jgi:hypothetical protein
VLPAEEPRIDRPSSRPEHRHSDAKGYKFDDSALYRYRDGMGPVVSAELGEYVRNVALDGLLAMESWPAISLFAFPAAISRSTSISREVKSSSAAWSASSAATSGGIRFWPAWTARMVSSSSLCTCPFNM